MNSTVVREAIAAVIERVEGVGIVQRYERYAKKTDDFVARYVDANVVRGWHVRRVAWREERLSSAYNRVTTTWRIQGYRSLVDADGSEVLLDQVLDQLAGAFRADPTLGGLVRECVDGDRDGLQLKDSGPVMFCGLLCHGVVLELPTVQDLPLGLEAPACAGEATVNMAWVMAGDRPADVVDAEDIIKLGAPTPETSTEEE